MIAKSKAVIWFAFFFEDGQSIEIIKSELSQEYPLQEVLYQGESIFLYRVTRFQASTVHENPILRPNQSPYVIVGL